MNLKYLISGIQLILLPVVVGLPIISLNSHLYAICSAGQYEQALFIDYCFSDRRSDGFYLSQTRSGWVTFIKD